jgi:hypothetical protein
LAPKIWWKFSTQCGIRLLLQFDYVHAEGERLTEVVDTIVQRGELSEAQWHEWLQGFPPLLEPPTMETYYRFINVKNFMYTLYFRSQRSEWPDFLRITILEAGTAVMKVWRMD